MQCVFPPLSLSFAASVTSYLLHFLPMWLAAPSWSPLLTHPAPLSLECCIWSCGLTDHPDTEDSQISFTSLDLPLQIHSHTPNCAPDISPCTPNRKLKGSLVGQHNSGFLSSPPKLTLILDSLNKYTTQLSTPNLQATSSSLMFYINLLTNPDCSSSKT